MLKGANTGGPGGTGSGVVDMGGGGGGGNVMRICGANADSADDMEDKADSGDWNCVSPSAVDIDDESVTRRCWWINDDSAFIDSLADGFGTPATKFSLAGIRLESSEADTDFAVGSTNGLLLGVAECLNEGIADLTVADTACAGGAI